MRIFNKRFILIFTFFIFINALNMNLTFSESMNNNKNLKEVFKMNSKTNDKIEKEEVLNRISLKKQIINEKEYYNLREYFNSLNNYYYFGEILMVVNNEFMIKFFNKKYLFNKDISIIDYKKENPNYKEKSNFVFSQRKNYKVKDGEVYVTYDFLYHFMGYRKELKYNNLYLHFMLEGYKNYSKEIEKYVYSQYGSKDIDLEYFNYVLPEFKNKEIKINLSNKKSIFKFNYADFKKLPIVVNIGARETSIEHIIYLEPLKKYKLNIETNNWFIQQHDTGVNWETNCVPTSMLNLIKWIYPETKLTTLDIRKYLDDVDGGIAIYYIHKNEKFKQIFSAIIKPKIKDIKKILDNGSPIMVGVNSDYLYDIQNNGTGHSIIISGYTEIDDKLNFFILDTGAPVRKNIFKLVDENELEKMIEPRFGGLIYFKNHLIEDKEKIKKYNFLK